MMLFLDRYSFLSMTDKLICTTDVNPMANLFKKLIIIKKIYKPRADIKKIPITNVFFYRYFRFL